MRRGVLIALALAALAAVAVALSLAPLSPGEQLRVVGTYTINALAVSSSGGGAVVPIEVTLLTPGNGRAYVAGVPEAGEGFGPSAQIALYVASRLAGVSPSNYTALIRVKALQSSVGGPSASGYITAALFALMKGLPLRNDTAMTGIILPDGTIGWVGGVQYKVEAAAQNGIKYVLVPLGEQGEAAGVSGVEVIPIATIQQAIYYLTGYNVTSPYNASSLNPAVFDNVSRELYEEVLAIYENATGPSASQYANMSQIEALAASGQYYVAASLLYSSLVNYYDGLVSRGSANSSALYNEALSLAKEYESVVKKIPITSNNLGIIIGLYERIYQVYQEANSSSPDVGLMYARVVTLPPWIDAARELAYGRAVNESALADMAEAYLQYAYVMYSYVETTYGSQLPSQYVAQLDQSFGLAQSLYSAGHYLAALAASLDTIAFSENLLAAPGADSLVGVERQVALQNAYRAAACGSPDILPLSYIQLGDYYNGSDNVTALYLYESASMYAAAIGDILCSPGPAYEVTYSPPPSVSVPAPPLRLSSSPQSAMDYIAPAVILAFAISVAVIMLKKR
ncbi:MAG: S16 family serine protease [Thermoproteus sp. AZ2]|uniref:S16 family serine protease n=1 Tax=Thermoproteus sp. AZ2 TaxID=1609232 RepID=A0ACC6V310_9CREN